MTKRDWWAEPFERMVVLGESTVEGGPFLDRLEQRWADVLAELISGCQDEPMQYYNQGIGANCISPRSPGYEASKKPSALERYRQDVIALQPDLFILCYGLNDMRAGMHPELFRQDMKTIITAVHEACHPLTVLTTVYHMTGYRSWEPFDQGGIDQTQVYNEVIRQLAESMDCLFADVWQAEGCADWLIHPDGVHANAIGNLAIAHRVFEVLIQNCSGLSAATNRRVWSTEWTRETTQARSRAGDPYKPTWE
jgi:lysophospholipase L1-like esterase